MYFNIFWMCRNWPTNCRERLLYWVPWHLVAKMSLLPVKKPHSVLLYYHLLGWRHVGTQHKSCWRAPTNYVNSHATGLKTPNTATTSHYSQHRMSGQMLSMWWRFRSIPVLDPVDVETAYPYFASHHHCPHWHVWYHWQRNESFGQEADLMEGRLILCSEVCTVEAV